MAKTEKGLGNGVIEIIDQFI